MENEYEAKILFLKFAMQNKHTYLLHFAVEVGDIALIGTAIRLGYGINVVDNKGMTPMHLAVLGGKKDIIELLRENGGDIGSVLHLGASRGYDGLVESVLSSGVDVSTTDMEGKTPLYKAAESGHLGTMLLLLKKGAQLGMLLHLASERGHMTAVQSLVSCGANLDMMDQEGRTALYRAASGGHEQVVAMLLNEGAKRTYLLHTALKARDVRAVRTLMLHDAPDIVNAKHLESVAVENINTKLKEMFQQDMHVSRLLHFAVKHGCWQNVRWLLESGADVNYNDEEDFSLLYWASKIGNIEMMQYLVSKGADLEEKDKKGRTLLYNAVEANDKKVVEALLKSGADVNVQTDEETWSYLHIAAWFNFRDIIVLLVEHGADVQLEDGFGRTAMDVAYDRGFSEIIRLLES